MTNPFRCTLPLATARLQEGLALAAKAREILNLRGRFERCGDLCTLNVSLMNFLMRLIPLTGL